VKYQNATSQTRNEVKQDRRLQQILKFPLSLAMWRLQKTFDKTSLS
jgi:hypothetical protein